ncbi:choice-of-anchor I family protein [Roseovarius sp. D22-M7]|uniref:choice-of-anchor I family protein n=1 Tax=Roseovarius sp. D22-M7 TaxID=3127116 RepID=UPI00301050FD
MQEITMGLFSFFDRLGFFPKELDFGPSLAALYETGQEGGSEVVQAQDGLLYVTNGEEDKIDVIDAATGALVEDVDLSGLPGYEGVQSVAVKNDLIAAAVSTTFDFQQSNDVEGWVVFYDVNELTAPPTAVPVGNLPDMVTFSQDGKYAFSANEGEAGEPGEPNEGTNPAGSISVIDLSDFSVTTVGFEGVEIPDGVRIFPGISPLVDLEPEYIAEAGGKLFVTLQEAAAVGVFDIESKSWDKIIPLGTQDHSVIPLDANDDGLIDIRTYENLVGMRMPDAIAATEIDRETYFLTANEGDDRGDWDEVELGPIGDAARIGDIREGEVAYTNPETGDTVSVSFTAELEAYLDSLPGDGLDRLNISIFDGVNDDGEIETMHAYGSRSFTIFDLDGNVVFDSGAQFEQLLSVFAPERFNNDDGEIISPNPDGEVDNRSDAKGPEPEAIEIGQIGDTTLAFIGLERTGEVMIYDISDPDDAKFLDFIDGRATGNVSPEIIEFIAPEDSATGEAQIAVAYEVSGSTAVFDLPFGEKIKGGFRDDVLTGSIGSDKIFGRAGDDEIDAGGHDDIVRGGLGDDVIDGGFGNDILTGGFGADVFEFNFFSGNDVIKDFRRDDVIDMTAAGLSFDDLTITKTGRKEFLIDYGDFGDSIEVNLKGFGNTSLTEGDFLF